DLASARRLFSLPHTDTVFRVLYSPDGTRLVTFGADAVVKIWAAETGALLHALTDPQLGASVSFRAGEVSPDGRVIVAIERETGRGLVWNTQAGTLLATLPTSSVANLRVAFSGDSRWLATS